MNESTPDVPRTTEGTRLDPWFDSYAARAHQMRSSEIRALFAVASRPEVVSLAGGMPFIGGLPLEDIGEMIDKLREAMKKLSPGS